MIGHDSLVQIQTGTLQLTDSMEDLDRSELAPLKGGTGKEHPVEEEDRIFVFSSGLNFDGLQGPRKGISTSV